MDVVERGEGHRTALSTLLHPSRQEPLPLKAVKVLREVVVDSHQGDEDSVVAEVLPDLFREALLSIIAEEGGSEEEREEHSEHL